MLGKGFLSRRISTDRRPCRIKDQTAETTKPSYFYEGVVLYGGTGRTIAVSRTRFSVGLEVGGKFGVPLQVTINKSASYGVRWNRIRDFCQHVVVLQMSRVQAPLLF